GTWLFRLDPTAVGIAQGFQKQATDLGWTRTTVPNAWNARDESMESFAGTVGWYRKDFKLPAGARRLFWIVRFESVNYRSKVWLNGKPLGTNRGAYLPFELRLPASLLRRGLTNRLVIRVDNRRRPTDFPPSNLNPKGQPTGGWWNYGGLLREVYLRRIDRIDFSTVQVQPNLPCSTCAATVGFRVTVRNYSASPQRVRLVTTFGARRLSLGTAAIGPKRFATYVRSIAVPHPRLWSIGQPNLYKVRLRATIKKDTVAGYYVETGIRSIKLVDGHILLNGKALNVRGVGYHEDSPQLGFAIDNRTRDQHLQWIKQLGATMIRSHYPLHPYTQERADELGILLWSEIPVYAVRTRYLKQRLVRELAAKELRDNILINGNHPSIVVWSIGNELSARPGPVQGYYIARAVRTAHALDPTRPVGLAVAGYPAAGCQSEYAPLDVIGVNDYFGWYPGPNGQIADRTLLSDWLESVHQCYPQKAIFVSEFGAEANRDGPVEEKGTYAFQDDFINYHLGVYASKPWLNGALYWAIQEFRVRPDWDGGNPHPDPPIHEKGLIAFDGRLKPAYFDVQKAFTTTPQLRSVRLARYHRPPHG
ncbi:MAG TPA: glycoside hydrolase family 2 TIM barrel-domain containing protein, partial [Solirubrobacteraceae bacterium]